SVTSVSEDTTTRAPSGNTTLAEPSPAVRSRLPGANAPPAVAARASSGVFTTTVPVTDSSGAGRPAATAPTPRKPAPPTARLTSVCRIRPSIRPYELQPHPQRVVSVLMPSEWSSAAAPELQPVPIWTGRVRCVVVPSPSCPEELRPNAHRLPSLLIARVCVFP